MADAWPVALLAATGLHAGFQLTVSVLVYPALARVADDGWRAEHEQHSRRIAPLVGVLYAAVLATCVGTLLTAPSYAAVVAAAGDGLALGVTATLAAPLHARLGVRRDPARVRRLLRVDRVRTVGALVALGGAVGAVLVR